MIKIKNSDKLPVDLVHNQPFFFPCTKFNYLPIELFHRVLNIIFYSTGGA